MNPDRDWALQSIAKLGAQYKELVKKKAITHGVCWFLRTNASVLLGNPNTISLADALGLSPDHSTKFYKCFGKSMKNKIIERFGDDVHFVAYARSPAIIFHTPGLPKKEIATLPERFGNAEMMKQFTIRLDKPPSELSNSGRLAPAPWMVPPASPTKRKDMKSVSPFRPKSPPKKTKTTVVNWNPLQYDALSNQFKVEDGVPMVNTRFEPKLMTKTQISRNKTNTTIVKEMQRVIRRKRTGVTDEVKDFIAAFSAMNPQISAEKIEMLLAIGRYSLLSEIPSLDFTLHDVLDGAPSARSIERWVENIAVDQAINQSIILWKEV